MGRIGEGVAAGAVHFREAREPQTSRDRDQVDGVKHIADYTESPGCLIINADDWGRDREITDRTLECVRAGAVSSVSGMVFMADSERAATLTEEFAIDTGLHLNLTTLFSDPACPARLAERQQILARFLRTHRFAQAVYHPGLSQEFDYVVKAQLEEFQRCYKRPPTRLDGHHHMHLCSNVLLTNLLPSGTIVRRSFSFQAGEKGLVNRLYRRAVDRILVRRHLLTDYFFSLPPLEPESRLERIFSLARQSYVEVETHPVKPDEFQFLAGGNVFRWTGDLRVAPRYTVRSNGRA